MKVYWRKWKMSNWYTRMFHWEYWPYPLIYAPIFFYWLYLSFKARAFMFFSAANPGIEFGGLLGESKMDILKKIPEMYLPKTLYVKPEESLASIDIKRRENGMIFPLIVKPDVGERGFLVEKVYNIHSLETYRKNFPTKLLLQEFVDYPEEVSILYYRFPYESSGCITSVTLKKYLSVKGDGHSSLRELILGYPRAKLQLGRLEKDSHLDLGKIPQKGEVVELVPIGNHSRGTTFFNGNHLIDEMLVRTFDRISRELDGIYFGRFDIKCKSFEDLKKGRHFKILEINGVKSEPTHIYEPGFSIFEAYRVLFHHWNIIYKLSMENINRGVDILSFREGIARYRASITYKRIAKS